SDDSYENLLRDATEDFQSGYYTEAKRQFEQALAEAKKNGASKANTASILHHLILAAIEDTSFDAAKKYLKELESLAGITDKTKTPSSREGAEAFYDQAAILMFQSSKDSKLRAEVLFKKALDYYSNASGVGIDRMRTLSRLGQLALMNEDLQKARDFMKQAVAVAEEDPSISQLELALRLDQLGDTYVLLANSTHNPKIHYQDAENLYSRALQLRRSVVRSEDHPALALSYKRLGIMYFHKKDYGKALEELNRSLAILKKNEAPLPMIAEIQRAISYVYLKQHDFDVAKKTFEEAIQMATAGGTTPASQIKKWRNLFDTLKKAESK
ncbi:MAG: tetratricopeptide repeat protein, partial [Cyanobacteria bacterium]|nr:tetratricopeptide repeat protein [Cyanobacteriota bacterium]